MKTVLNFSKIGIFCVALGLVFMTSTAVAGPKWEITDDSWLKLSLLGQVHFSYMDKAVDKEDFYLRRGRIILAGQIQDGINFFVETDNDNAGKSGAPEASMDIQDAWMDVRFGHSDHWVQAGLILLPFSFENRSSAASLLGIDYNAETIKFVNHFVWRDYGVEFHGNIGEKFAYRAGFFDGYESAEKNPGADLRFTGHVAFNLIGKVETGWFYTNNRLGKSEYLTVGIGHDCQEDATVVGGVVQDSEATVIDFQSGFNLGDTAYNLTVNGAYCDWDNSGFKGDTAFIEGGLLYDKYMVTLKYSLQDEDNESSIDDFTAGLHYFIKNHNARVGLEYRWGDSNDWALLGIQFLL